MNLTHRITHFALQSTLAAPHLTTLCLGASLVMTAQAATLTFDTTTPINLDPPPYGTWGGCLFFPHFDSSLGTLTKVTFHIESTASWHLWAANYSTDTLVLPFPAWILGSPFDFGNPYHPVSPIESDHVLCGPITLQPGSYNTLTFSDISATIDGAYEDPAILELYKSSASAQLNINWDFSEAPLSPWWRTLYGTDKLTAKGTVSYDYIPPIAFNGFLPPIGGADGTGGSCSLPLRTFKFGSTIPVKFIAQCAGAPLTVGVHTLKTIKYSDTTTEDVPLEAAATDEATTGDVFRFTGDEWLYNLDTRATGMSIGIWQIVATLSDGSTHWVWIQLK